MEDIRLNGGILIDAIQHITPEAVKNSGLFEPYSIILATTATIGEHAMLIADSLANQRFTNFKIRKSQYNKFDPYYVYYYFFKIDEWCLTHTNAGGLLSVDIPSLKQKQFYTPCKKEQSKIASLFKLLDERITTQNKIIDKLQSLIGGIESGEMKNISKDGKWVKLGDICNITTGKLDANAMVDGGRYPFFTCAETPYSINEYAFDTEALLISGNGVNLGYINYYKGRFNAYQRTYVLDAFTEDIHFIKFALKVFLPKRIAIKKSTSNTPYIVMSTLSEMKLSMPSRQIQKRLSTMMNLLENSLTNHRELLFNYSRMKEYLLQNMFI